jgi:hypothetical protein
VSHTNRLGRHEKFISWEGTGSLRWKLEALSSSQSPRTPSTPFCDTGVIAGKARFHLRRCSFCRHLALGFEAVEASMFLHEIAVRKYQGST